MSGELNDDVEAQSLVSPEPQRRQTNLPWSFSLAGLCARLADAAEASGSRAERRDSRERTTEASTTGRELQLDAPTVLTSTESGSLTSRSLGGILRQLSGRRDGLDTRNESPETTAAAAERHRLTGNSSSIDLQALTQWLEKNGPFIFIMLLVFVSRHLTGILVFCCLTGMLAAGNNFIRKQISLKDGRHVARLLLMMALFMVVVPAILLLPQSCLSWRAVILLLPAKIETVWDCLFCITIADGAIRTGTMAAKLGVVALSSASPDDMLRRRSQVLTLMEHVSLLYRALLPTPLWFVYLYKGRGVLSSIFTGAFLATKCQFVYERANNVASSVRSVWRREAQYGRYLSQEDLAETGSSCAICQEHMTRPFQLSHCRHTFCDACLTEWLERQCTCPMCRAIVRPPGLQVFGNGAVSLLPQLF